MQKRALGFLFAGIAAALVAVAAAALAGAEGGARWVIALAALALAGWMASNAHSVLRK